MRGTVSDVIDGDTIYVFVKTNTIKVRLSDIDTPEKKQPYGLEAKDFVIKTALGKIVIVKYRGKDRYGRIVGTVIIGTNDVSINQELLKSGLAYWYRQYSTNQALGILEMEAKTNKLGIWSLTNSIPPWEWRKKHK